MKTKEYEFIGKTLFFPDYGILVIGDLHLGYEHSVRQSGILIPENQIKEVISDLEKTFTKIKLINKKLKKIIFLGDIKHSFGYEKEEKNYFREVIDYLKQNINEKNILLIKGNHDTINYSSGKMKNYYIYKDIAFLHGHELFTKVFDEKIKTIVMGHIHPSVILRDKQNIKREKYKCFLIGKFKNKNIIILPSFLSTIEGNPVNSYKNNYENSFSIISKKSLLNFQVFVIGEDKVYEFGKVKEMN
jgi:hypothetical protein